MGTVATEVSPLPEGPVKTRSVILSGYETMSQGPGISPTVVMSAPVGIVTFGFEDPQEVSNPAASIAANAVVPVRFSIPFRFPPPLVPPKRGPERFAPSLPLKRNPNIADCVGSRQSRVVAPELPRGLPSQPEPSTPSCPEPVHLRLFPEMMNGPLGLSDLERRSALTSKAAKIP